MEKYDHTKTTFPVAKNEQTCTECVSLIGEGVKYEYLRCRDKLPSGRTRWLNFRTCPECLAQRQEFCTEFFTPGYLLQDLEQLKSKIAYDDSFGWAKVTNAVAAFRLRRKAALASVPNYTPTPLRGPRVVYGGFAT